MSGIIDKMTATEGRELMSVIVRQSGQFYLPPMASGLFRLLALLALMLMPAGMAGAQALAQLAPAGGNANHCDDHGVPDSAPAQPHCTGCAALPALEPPPAIGGPPPEPKRFIARVEPFSGIILEIATPPPKLG
jgi:hypothetical protein